VTYYKATRTDGTSFYDSKTKWTMLRDRSGKVKGTHTRDLGIIKNQMERAVSL